MDSEFSFLELSQGGIEKLEILSDRRDVNCREGTEKSHLHLNLLGRTRKLGGLLRLRRTNSERLLVIVVDRVISLSFTLREG